jgi:DDE superfamily endonuclease
LPPEAEGKPLEVWFQDEARIGQKGTLTRVWARKGSRPRKPRDTRYEWAYLFGAVCPARATGAAIVMPYADTQAMNEHLAVIAGCVAPGAHGVIVLDGAGWHASKGLVIPPNLTLIAQPPFAPEVNPVENVWQYLRQNQLAIRTYQTYETIVDACCQAWNDLMATPHRIVSLATRQRANVS